MDDAPRRADRPPLGTRIRRYLAELASLLTRRDRHRDRLADIDVRISVSGTRGKSTLVRWFHDELADRGYDTYAKVTGTDPLSIYNGREWVVPRSGRTTLYENERELRKFFPMDAVVLENQGITPYTTRLFNTRYVDPTLVVVTNVREDHLDTLGEDRGRIARSLARSIPEGTHVICGEQGASLRRYLSKELNQRGATVTFVDIPGEFLGTPGAELVYCLDEALREVDGQGLDPDRAETYLESLRVEWKHLPEGRVLDAAAVNDVQSTEATRRALRGGTTDVIQPLVYLRHDRPGRTASYARYLDLLAEQGHVEQARIVNGHARAFDARTDVPVVIHSASEQPDAVLSEALGDGWPVILMGNATPEFMQELSRVVEERDAAGAPEIPGLEANGRPSLETVATGSAQLLVLDRSPDSPVDDVRIDLLEARPFDRVLFVALARSADEHLRRWRASGGTADRARVITVEEGERGAAVAEERAPREPGVPDAASVVAVDDVAELGRALATTLAEWESEDVRVCFDSVARIIEERRLENAFRMLHVVTRQLAGSGATAHYHFRTEEYEERTVGTLEPLFDTVVTVNENGKLRVNPNERTRRPEGPGRETEDDTPRRNA